MNIELKEFQQSALERLLRHAKAAAGAVGSELSAIVLAAPTGSGKTVVATALMERIAAGDDEGTGDPDAVFLWLTDQPELNEQTRKKFEANSDIFGSAKLVTLENSFSQPRLEPGFVYFLNTQKLGRKSLLIRRGDHRPQTIWEVIANTIREAPGSFWLVIDEAHRGMGVSLAEREEAQTIVQKFILGSEEGGLPPVPLILGISATPQRFDELLEGTARTRRPVEIKPEYVRESGLLKDLVVVSHPAEKQAADVTLLRAAAAELKTFREAWSAYAKEESARQVEPLLVVQVEDARSSVEEVSRTPLDEVMTALEAELGPLEEDEVGHALQDGHAITIGERSVRYIAPSDIEEDAKLRVVLFKSSLNTGWDCPRAEVMMSFRRAADLTHIAQLVGRMVRTPLARRISTNELLNSVSLYLPHWDEEALADVVGFLSSPDPELGIGTEVKLREETIELALDPERAAAVALANTLPTYSIERIAKTTNVRRLLRLGRELAYDKLDKTALARYRTQLLDLLEQEREKRKRTKSFKEALAGAATLDVRRVGVAYGQEGELVVEEVAIEVAAENIDDLFAQAGRRLGEGLHSAYVKRRVGTSKGKAKGKAPTLATAKQELWALLQIEEVRTALEVLAGIELTAAFTKHDPAVRKLGDERRQRYRRLRKQAQAPEPYTIELPRTIVGRATGANWKQHLYVSNGKSYRADLNRWETEVLRAALAEDGVVGWLRNVPRKEWALCVPYKGPAGDERGLYPDFLIFREHEGNVVCDILDPHSHALADAWPKAVGLANFATRHGDEFGRIRLIAKIRGTLKELDLKDEDTLEAVRAIDSNASLQRALENG